MAIRGDVAALTAPRCVPCSTWRDMCVPEEKRGGVFEKMSGQRRITVRKME